MITCKELAQEVKDEVRQAVATLTTKPSLAIISVGDDPASEAYVRGKIKDCEEVGIIHNHIRLSADCTDISVINAVKDCNKTCDAIIVQLPLPDHLNADVIMSFINKYKDVDGLTPDTQYTPCTALGVFEWMKCNMELQGKHVVIINRSKLVGRPLAKLLIDADATVTMCHSKTTDLDDYTLMADVVVTAVGKPGFIDYCNVSDKSVVVDVGISRIDGKLYGDYRHTLFDKLYRIQATPVPGGVGLLTRAYLMKNVLTAYLNQRGE